MEGEGGERPRGDGAPAEPSGKGEGVEKGPGQFEVEIARLQIGVAQRHQPRVRDAQRGHPARDAAAAVGQAQRIDPHLQHPAAVRAHAHVPPQHPRRGRPREATIDKREIAERRRVRPQSQIEQQGAMGPADGATGVPQRGPRQPHARESDLHRVADHPQPTRDVDQPHPRVGALEREARHVDPDAALARRGHLQGREVRVEMFEPAHPHPSVRAAAGDLQRRIAGLGVARLEPQRDAAVADVDVAQQDERRWPMLARVRSTQPQELLDVQPPARVLYDVDHRAAQVELEQHHPPRREIERVVAHVRPGQPGDERGVCVEQANLREGETGEQGAPHVADLDRAREHLVQGPRRHAREQRASSVRAHE